MMVAAGISSMQNRGALNGKSKSIFYGYEDFSE